MARTLFVGDVHGCSDELARLLKKTRPTRVVLVGDLFTKGPDPVGVWKLIRDWEAEAVLGNHDDAVLRTWTPGRELPKKAFRWLRRRPYLLTTRRWLAVHAGVHPNKPKRTDAHTAMHVRRWPAEQPEHPYWWERYRGDRLVVHGHDARNGLIDRRPYTLGLDTGCVKGGRLTGYLLEKDRVVSVRARRAYVD